MIILCKLSWKKILHELLPLLPSRRQYELNDHALLRLVIRDLASHDDASNPLAPILSPILRGEVSNRLYGLSTPPILASTSSSCV